MHTIPLEDMRSKKLVQRNVEDLLSRQTQRKPQFQPGFQCDVTRSEKTKPSENQSARPQKRAFALKAIFQVLAKAKRYRSRNICFMPMNPAGQLVVT
jgi:hypothetical protein